jgi:transcriptional regulator with XRE-family HTH domain
MIDGEKLLRARLLSGLSQRKLAAAAGTNAQTILRLERGADGGELPARVINKTAQALGVPIADLLDTPANSDSDAPVETLGSLLLEHRTLSLDQLAAAAEVPLDRIGEMLNALAVRLVSTGMALVRHDGRVTLQPQTHARAAPVGSQLTLHQARLLRRIHRGEDVRRKLSKVDRELTLPSLIRGGLVELDGTAPRLSAQVAESVSSGIGGSDSRPRLRECSE